EAGGPEYDSDVMFAGGADADRVPYIHALVSSGWHVHVYGAYWDRYPETRAVARGLADADMLREAVANARGCPCLVRKSNRDGHSMRTFEVPAMRGCAVMERTPEHLAIFGEDGRHVLYFETIEEMRERISWILQHPLERDRLADACYRWIHGGAHTYQDRLATILQIVDKQVLRH